MSTTTETLPLDTLRASVYDLAVKLEAHIFHLTNSYSNLIKIRMENGTVKKMPYIDVSKFYRMTAYGLVEVKRRRHVVTPLGFMAMKRLGRTELARIKETLEQLRHTDSKTFGHMV